MIHRARKWVMRFDLSDKDWALLEPLFPNCWRITRVTGCFQCWPVNTDAIISIPLIQKGRQGSRFKPILKVKEQRSRLLRRFVFRRTHNY